MAGRRVHRTGPDVSGAGVSNAKKAAEDLELDLDFAGDGDGSDLDADGIGMEGIAALQFEWMERKFSSPSSVYGQPYSKGAWRLVAAELMRSARKTRSEALRDSIVKAMVMARLMPAGASPWQYLRALHDAEIAAVGFPDREAQRAAREASYKVMMEEFVGRQVG